MTNMNQYRSPSSALQFACFSICLLNLSLTSADLMAQEETSAEQQLRRLIPSATAMDRKLLETMATSQVAPKVSDYNDHSLTFTLFATSFETAQKSGGQFRYLTDKTPKPNLMAKEMYRSIGGGRFRIVTHPVTMIQLNRITKFDVQVEGRSASGTFEFHVPELYEGKADFTAEQTVDKWRITRLQMPKLEIDLKSDESGQWWPAEDLKDHDPPKCLVGHTGTIWSLDFSKDGTRLVSGGSDRSVRIWDVAERKSSRTIPRAHPAKPSVPIEGGVLSVCFSPDENSIATCSDDGTVKIWNAATGEQQRTIAVKGIVSEAMYSPDGRSILSSSSALEIWNARTGGARTDDSRPLVSVNRREYRRP